MTIAIYARKSNEKKNDSIENQLSIIRSYISQQKELQDAEILQFSDDGFSGIDMNRDSFQELLSKVRKREIDVIVVKDLSRLGRNYLDVCKLTDSILPFMGVRLIAVSEHYDSQYQQRNTMDLPTVFKAVLNEYYVTESSEKIQKSCRTRIQNGEFVSAVPYGYFLSDKFTPLIDEKKAEIVRKIFQLFLDGNSILTIARMLNKQGIPTSSGVTWTYCIIRRILKNEQYIGKRVSLTHTKDVKTNKYIPNDKSKWYVNEHAFPPIIEREVFDKVQLLFPKPKGKDTSDKHIMARKIYCAGCGRTLRKQVHFYCRNGYVTGGIPCFRGSLKYDVLYKAVLEKVKCYIKTEIPDVLSNFSLSDIARIETEIMKLREKKAKIFEKLYAGTVTEQEFAAQNQAVSHQITAYQDDLERCRKSVALYAKYGSSERPIDTLRRLYEAPELTKEHMQFVKRINVFDSEHFEILLQDSSPLEVLCRNMSIYGEGL